MGEGEREWPRLERKIEEFSSFGRKRRSDNFHKYERPKKNGERKLK